ncbi:hypothetical protein SASPL_134053 [Salvia splendens]|uniref:WAT1-related protein n=1 Tax=Salvia splendens TaxID=180675 RepID=A0A8X8ZIY7_SALSN|nr:hypothetical protein SASPL_134053 [Salvia splendens]
MADAAAGSSMGRRMCSIPEKFQLHIAMLALQFGYAGFHVVSRLALNMGISKIVFPVYRNILAFILLLPFAYFLEKIEKVRLDRKDGISKVVGLLICVAGASVITLFKGPTIYSPPATLQRAAAEAMAPVVLGDASGKSWTMGCLYLIGHCLSWAGWLVLQAPVLKRYPARLSFTSYQCFFGILQFLVIAAFFERNGEAWLIRTGSEVFSVFYAGVVASGIAFAVQIWCIDKGGPVFVAVYQPVQTLVVAITSSLLLGEEFYLGGYAIIGAGLIIFGLYLVLWGKSEEKKFAAIQSHAEHSTGRATPQIKASITQPLLTQSTENV